MSRFGEYGDDDGLPGHWHEIDVARSIDGPKGQRRMREIVDALLALPERVLIEGAISARCGDEPSPSVCFVGAIALHKGVEVARIRRGWEDQYGGMDTITLGKQAGLTLALANRCAALNDVTWEGVDPEERWRRAYRWACARVRWSLPMVPADFDAVLR